MFIIILSPVRAGSIAGGRGGDEDEEDDGGQQANRVGTKQAGRSEMI